jgi:hypothetical protein
MNLLISFVPNTLPRLFHAFESLFKLKLLPKKALSSHKLLKNSYSSFKTSFRPYHLWETILDMRTHLALHSDRVLLF